MSCFLKENIEVVFIICKVIPEKSAAVHVKIDPDALANESAIFKCPNPTKYMKAVNEASLSIAQENVGLLKKKGKLFEEAKKKVHQMGYSYAKQSSRSKVFGDCSPESMTASKKRKYIPTKIRMDRIDELTESIKSVSETIEFLIKQKEQYANASKFQQAADVNSSIMQKTNEQRKLQKELKKLEEAGEKSETYKKKKQIKQSHNQKKGPYQKQLSWGESSKSCMRRSGKSDGSSGGDTVSLSDADTIILSDVELSPVRLTSDHEEDDEDVPNPVLTGNRDDHNTDGDHGFVRQFESSVEKLKQCLKEPESPCVERVEENF